MNNHNNIEYLGYNISPKGVILKEKIYYFWESYYYALLPGQLIDILSPFDYAIRDEEELSISCFIRCDSHGNLERIFKFIESKIPPNDIDNVRNQFFSIYDSAEGVHYPPILSFKYKMHKLNKLSLYVSPLQQKSEMEKYLKRTLRTFIMKHSKDTRMIINDLVTTKICDMYMAAWDLDENGCYSYKVYLKIKNRKAIQEILLNLFSEIKPYLQKEQFRLSDIGFVFVNEGLSHYNLYYKPLP